jgi:predicted nucleotidyltransferase
MKTSNPQSPKGKATAPDKTLSYIASRLRDKYRCHTAILYGSRARGDWTERSDYDVVGFSDSVKETVREARAHRGRYLDLFVCPTSKLASAAIDQVQYCGGLVLFEKGSAGTAWLAKLDGLHRKGPKRLPASEAQVLRTWAKKTFERGAVPDVEGRYRTYFLIVTLLEDYFSLRQRWYQGSKLSFQWLAENDPKVMRLFAKVFENAQDRASLAKLVRLVTKDA